MWQQIVNRKENQEYVGHAEQCTYTFSLGPEQLPGTRWTAQQIINAHVDALAEQDSRLLELRVWEDASPTWETRYHAEVVATASPLYWTPIIIGILLILAIVAIAYTITEIADIVRYVGDKAPGAVADVATAVKLLAIAAVGAVGLIALSKVARRST